MPPTCASPAPRRPIDTSIRPLERFSWVVQPLNQNRRSPSMTRTILSYLSILLMAVVTASADQLDFSDLQIGEEVLGYYNGGFGSLGTGPGPNLGVTFTADFVTVATGLPFQAEELTSASGIMDVLHGFNGTLSFYYTNSGPDDGAVNLYSGLDGSGSLLGTIALFAQATPDFTP